MKAWFTVPGPQGATREIREIPVPAPGPGQVIVTVRAAGTNRGELIRGAQLHATGPAAAPARSSRERSPPWARGCPASSRAIA
jgi:NADPH:quinone reductase-like Zn-dependent oxidoreductase